MSFETDEFKGSRVLVTGGSGFIGTHLIHALRELGVREITNIHRGNKPIKEDACVSHCLCDMSQIESRDVVRKLGAVDYVFNLVGLVDQRMPHSNPEELWNANVVTLVNLTQGLNWSTVKGAVHIGTTAEYGNQEVPFCEDQELKPTNAYGWSKAASSLYAMMMTQGGFAKWCVARQFTGYGPGHTAGFIYDITCALKRGEEFIVSPFSVTRDLVFVGDMVEGMLRLAVAGNAMGEIVNLCSGKEITIGEIASIIHGMIGKGSIKLVEREPRKGDFLRSLGDTTKMERLLGWKPAITLEQGLQITVPTIE
ncbi:MAG: NAD-dependent epimerase/dehydratase family protein [Candidatus Sungbacteria bacterium]|nr:NAD-dependent epimerase/dehydratase family protein [bacterium]MDZ4285444.1 NAD-dependent epimerase/dehydratase family protein [Candidatus Sungbacteria bacterium]